MYRNPTAIDGHRYAWIITRDLTDKIGEFKGTAGPHWATRDEVSFALADGLVFRLFDDDGQHYYSGRIWFQDPTDADSELAFAPLEDFGGPNAGCTEIRYRDAAGKWVAL